MKLTKKDVSSPGYSSNDDVKRKILDLSSVNLKTDEAQQSFRLTSLTLSEKSSNKVRESYCLAVKMLQKGNARSRQDATKEHHTEVKSSYAWVEDSRGRPLTGPHVCPGEVEIFSPSEAPPTGDCFGNTTVKKKMNCSTSSSQGSFDSQNSYSYQGGRAKKEDDVLTKPHGMELPKREDQGRGELHRCHGKIIPGKYREGWLTSTGDADEPHSRVECRAGGGSCGAKPTLVGMDQKTREKNYPEGPNVSSPSCGTDPRREVEGPSAEAFVGDGAEPRNAPMGNLDSQSLSEEEPETSSSGHPLKFSDHMDQSQRVVSGVEVSGLSESLDPPPALLMIFLVESISLVEKSLSGIPFEFHLNWLTEQQVMSSPKYFFDGRVCDKPTDHGNVCERDCHPSLSGLNWCTYVETPYLVKDSGSPSSRSCGDKDSGTESRESPCGTLHLNLIYEQDHETLAVASLDLTFLGTSDVFRRVYVELLTTAGVFAVVTIFVACQQRWMPSRLNSQQESYASPHDGKGKNSHMVCPRFVTIETDNQANFLHKFLSQKVLQPQTSCLDVAGEPTYDQTEMTSFVESQQSLSLDKESLEDFTDRAPLSIEACQNEPWMPPLSVKSTTGVVAQRKGNLLSDQTDSRNRDASMSKPFNQPIPPSSSLHQEKHLSFLTSRETLHETRERLSNSPSGSRPNSDEKSDDTSRDSVTYGLETVTKQGREPRHMRMDAQRVEPLSSSCIHAKAQDKSYLKGYAKKEKPCRSLHNEGSFRVDSPLEKTINRSKTRLRELFHVCRQLTDVRELAMFSQHRPQTPFPFITPLVHEKAPLDASSPQILLQKALHLCIGLCQQVAASSCNAHEASEAQGYLQTLESLVHRLTLSIEQSLGRGTQSPTENQSLTFQNFTVPKRLHTRLEANDGTGWPGQDYGSDKSIVGRDRALGGHPFRKGDVGEHQERDSLPKGRPEMSMVNGSKPLSPVSRDHQTDGLNRASVKLGYSSNAVVWRRSLLEKKQWTSPATHLQHIQHAREASHEPCAVQSQLPEKLTVQDDKNKPHDKKCREKSTLEREGVSKFWTKQEKEKEPWEGGEKEKHFEAHQENDTHPGPQENGIREMKQGFTDPVPLEVNELTHMGVVTQYIRHKKDQMNDKDPKVGMTRPYFPSEHSTRKYEGGLELSHDEEQRESSLVPPKSSSHSSLVYRSSHRRGGPTTVKSPVPNAPTATHVDTEWSHGQGGHSIETLQRVLLSNKASPSFRTLLNGPWNEQEEKCSTDHDKTRPTKNYPNHPSNSVLVHDPRRLEVGLYPQKSRSAHETFDTALNIGQHSHPLYSSVEGGYDDPTHCASSCDEAQVRRVEPTKYEYHAQHVKGGPLEHPRHPEDPRASHQSSFQRALLKSTSVQEVTRIREKNSQADDPSRLFLKKNTPVSGTSESTMYGLKNYRPTHHEDTGEVFPHQKRWDDPVSIDSRDSNQLASLSSKTWDTSFPFQAGHVVMRQTRPTDVRRHLSRDTSLSHSAERHGHVHYPMDRPSNVDTLQELHQLEEAQHTSEYPRLSRGLFSRASSMATTKSTISARREPSSTACPRGAPSPIKEVSKNVLLPFDSSRRSLIHQGASADELLEGHGQLSSKNPPVHRPLEPQTSALDSGTSYLAAPRQPKPLPHKRQASSAVFFSRTSGSCDPPLLR